VATRAVVAGIVGCLVLAVVGTALVARRPPVDDTVLRVDGWSLSRSELRDELQQIVANPGYLEARGRNGQPRRVFREGSSTEFDPALVAELLNERVTFQLAAVEVARRQLAVTDADRAAARQVVEDGLATGAGPAAGTAGAGTGTPGTEAPSPGATVSGRAVLDAFGSYRDVLLTGVVNLQVLQRALGLGTGVSIDEAARILYDRTRDQISVQSCVRHLLVRAGAAPTGGVPAAPPSDAEYAAALDRATALKARADAGEDFAALAAASSDDPSSRVQGGDLGCAPKGRYEAAFDEAAWSQPVGTIGAPVRSSFGYHLVLVYDRRERSFDELLPTLRQAVRDQGQEALQAWLRDASRKAAVTVDPGVGRWNAETGLVDPPGGTAATMSLVPQTTTGPSR
jgi:hypothetical protein